MNRKPHVVALGGTLKPKSRSLGALIYALRAAEEAGASTELLALNALDLPMFHPSKQLEDYGSNVQQLIESARRADAMLWSTAGYHGTLAGVTKNALDFFEYLSGGPKPYLDGKVIGLISVAGGELASVNAIGAMVHTVHSLRGTVASLLVAIPQARQNFDANGNPTHERWLSRLTMLGRQVVELAARHQTDPTLFSE